MTSDDVLQAVEAAAERVKKKFPRSAQALDALLEDLRSEWEPADEEAPLTAEQLKEVESVGAMPFSMQMRAAQARRQDAQARQYARDENGQPVRRRKGDPGQNELCLCLELMRAKGISYRAAMTAIRKS